MCDACVFSPEKMIVRHCYGENSGHEQKKADKTHRVVKN